MDQLRALLPSLRAAVTSNAATASGLLSQCKVLLIELPSAVSSAAPSEEELALSRTSSPAQARLHCPQLLTRRTPPHPTSTPCAACCPPACLLAGEVLELSVTHAIRAADWRSFELQVTQALPLCTAGAFGRTAPAREGWRLLTGLQLMHLLVEARLSDFHCRVESLSEEDIASAPISFPLRLEAFLLEGGYNKVGGCCPSQGGALAAPLPRLLRAPRSHCQTPRARSRTAPHAPACTDPQQRLSGSAARALHALPQAPGGHCAR